MTTTRFRLFFKFEKEEKWLSEMAAGGYALFNKSCLGFYRFRSVDPKDVVIRIDYRCFKGKTDFADYKTLFEDSGWEHLAGSISSGTQYFEKLDGCAHDDIFSDQASKAGRYRRLSGFFFSLAAAWLPLMVVALTRYHANFQAILNPKLLYQTPGLWEKTAAGFWETFLFETPFALLRGIPLLAFPVLVAFASISAICTAVTYRKSNR